MTNKTITMMPNMNAMGGQIVKQSLFGKITNSFSSMNWKMILLLLFVIVSLSLISYFFYKNVVKSNTAYTATRENMDGGNNKDAELLLFYVDWCPHCKTAKPEWEKLKAEYEGKSINGYNVVFTEYNCTTETAEVEELMNKYKIEGYPTIKLIKDNQIIEYDAKPTKTTMEQFLNSVL